MHGKVIIINNAYCSSSETMGKILTDVFLRKLLASLEKPEVIIFYNSGVKLLTAKSETLTILEALQVSGVDLIACGMCVNGSCHNQPLRIGRMTSMDEIVSILMKAQVVITL